MSSGTSPDVTRRLGAALVGLVSLGALVLQYVLILQNTRDTIGPVLGTVRFISYFTILSNLGVVLVTLTFALRRGGIFSRADARGVVALCIGVTGIVYTAILRHLWSPQGAQWWADSGLHYAVPLLYVLWWVFLSPHAGLAWTSTLRWLVFPAVYTVWVFVRGAWVHEYPYPFLDVDQLGWSRVLVNSVGVLVLFVVVGLLLVAIDRLLAKRLARPSTA